MNGSGSGYGVETDTLVSAGEKFTGIADEAAEAMGEFSGKAEALEGANEGFATTSKANALAKEWQRQIDDLCKRTSVAGELLQDSSDSYQKMEQSVLDILPPLSPED